VRRAILLPASIAALLTGLAAQAIAAGSTYAVDSTEDLPDVDPADGVCAAIDGHCTLRAAVMQANNTPGPTRSRYRPATSC
jgi:hypothetical protein